MTKHRFAIGLLFLFLSFIKPSFALGKLGHQVVCQLAFVHLSPAQQNHLTRLLNSIPKKHQRLINRYNSQPLTSSITFAKACTWADAIKSLAPFKRYNRWHYMNLAREQLTIKVNDCQQDCLPQAILQHQQIVAQAHNQYNWQQVQALLFLGHWLGDIHQPLHISFADDLGGNNLKLTHTNTRCNNLHWYWDDCLLSLGKHSKAKWLARLTINWSQHNQPNWQAEQVWQWADESFQLAKEPSVLYCQLNNQKRCQKPVNKINLPPYYLVQHQRLMQQRLLIAAQRLTKILAASL